MFTDNNHWKVGGLSKDKRFSRGGARDGRADDQCCSLGFGGRAMAIYRVYKLGDDGRISGPPHVVDCRDDEAAMREAHRLLRGHVREVWDLARFVGRIVPARKRTHTEEPPTKP